MQLIAIGAAAGVLLVGGLMVWSPWDTGFESDGLTCEGAPIPFEGALDGRIRFEIHNEALAATGNLCVFDEQRQLRWVSPASLPAEHVSIFEVPVPRERLASRAEFAGPTGSSASGYFADVADCKGGIMVHNMSFRFTAHGAGGSSGGGDGFDCDLPWTSWYDQGQPDAQPQQAGLGAGPSAPDTRRTDGHAFYIGLGVAGAAGGIAWFLRTKLAWMLFTRLRRSHVLDQKVRAQIHELVAGDPGIHAHKIAQTLELAQGQVAYHLSVLTREGVLRRVGRAGRRHYFVTGSYHASEMERVAALRSGPVSALFAVIAAAPGLTVSEVATRLGWSVHRTSRELSKMEREGLVDRRRTGRFVHVYPKGATPAPTPPLLVPAEG